MPGYCEMRKGKRRWERVENMLLLTAFRIEDFSWGGEKKKRLWK